MYKATVMQIEHVAVYTKDLEALKSFYARYFGARVGKKYVNASKQFESYFLSFPGGPRLEIMSKPLSAQVTSKPGVERYGWIHIALSVGSVEQVDAATSELKKDGYEVVDGPHWTGDGCYESVVLDPDGNRLEITV
jgi:lactoylglutathione lyase